MYTTLQELAVIDSKALDKAFEIAKKENSELANILIEKELITHKNLGMVLADLVNLPFVDLTYTSIEPDVLHLVPYQVAKTQNIIVFARDEENLSVATSKPDQTEIFNLLKKKTGLEITCFFTTHFDIEKALGLYITDYSAIFSKMTEQILKNKINSISEKTSASVIELVESIIDYAQKNRASDIHLEPQEETAVLRFRIDGLLHDIFTFPKEIYEQIVMRLKVLSQLRTDEQNSVQDGKFQISLENENLDMRISIVPITDGEKIVIRLLSEKSRQFSLEELGLRGHDLEKMQTAYLDPHGMILVTGPTGSGKTTTLYAILKILNTRDVNIMTIEDPVEYDIEGINQIQVNTATEVTFATGLRSIVRQDPDIILVGEIRDVETADIAINAAMTGHQVLSTLHTNDAATALPRLIDMEVEPFLVASSVSVILAQRLVRKICQNCRVSQQLHPDDQIFTQHPELVEAFDLKTKKSIDVYAGKGCPVCGGTGYKDRIGIFEVLPITDEIQAAINEKQYADDITTLARQQGMSTMYEDGIQKVKEGITTLEEVLRVIQE